MNALRRSYPQYTQGTLKLIDYDVDSKSLAIEFVYDKSISLPTEVYLNSECVVSIYDKTTMKPIDS